MSFRHYSKSISELQQIALVIHNNFSELVGCKLNSKKWSPTVGYHVCESLLINGTECSNVANDYELDNGGILEFKLSSSVNVGTKNIWAKVLNYDTEVLDLSYGSSLKILSNLPTSDKLRICVDQSIEYDCGIYEACQSNNHIKYSEHRNRLYLILLSCFTIRYHLYNFSMRTEATIDDLVINDTHLDVVISNIQYEKNSLSKLDFGDEPYNSSVEFIQQQLSLLLKNCRQLKAYVLPYIR